MSPLLLHLHIPKCGGISIRKYLANVGPIYRFEGLAKFERERDQAARSAVVSGHFAFGIHERIDRPAVYFILLRDPVERVASWFDYVKGHSGHKHHAIISTAGMTIARLYDERQPAVRDIADAQVRIVAGNRSPDGAENLAVSRANIQGVNCIVGTIEDLPGAVNALRAGFKLPAKQPPHTNRGPAHEISAEDRAAIIAHNLNDLAFYEQFRPA